MKYLEYEDFEENVAIIKINKSYRERMSREALYDATRGCWKYKKKTLERADYALSVAFGVVKEVYKINRWERSENEIRATIPYDKKLDEGRMIFIGEVANDDIRDKYIGNRVDHLFKKGNVHPVMIISNR